MNDRFTEKARNAIEKARAIIEEKNPTLENKDEVAKQVGVGAIVFHYLSNSRIKDINFVIDAGYIFCSQLRSAKI